MNSFNELQLPNALSRALEAIQFSTPTPIQAKAIPSVLEGRDLIACAQTGTGKTAAFCLPIAVKLLADAEATALVLAPTRELALQIEAFWRTLARFAPELRSACLIGGAAMKPQMKALREKPRILIATPGRLLDFLGQRAANLSRTAFLVLDEADRMLDMGFAPQLVKILKHVPRERQTLLFSATWDPALDKLAKTHLREPWRITIGAVSQAAPKIEQQVINTTVHKKNETLLGELKERQGSVLVFARTQKRTDRVAKYLNAFGLEVARIHGGRTQVQRNSALQSFKKGQSRILIATDIAARGIDVADIAHVINYDLPQAAEDYVHRIGRTGRAGKSGTAVSFVTSEDRGQWNEISKLLKKSGSTLPV